MSMPGPEASTVMSTIPSSARDRLSRQLYGKYGVEEYQIYDPADGSLAGWRRAANRLEEVPKMSSFLSPMLVVRSEPGEGPSNLRIVGPDGQSFATYEEVVAQRDAERRRADRLAARLRELDIDPD